MSPEQKERHLAEFESVLRFAYENDWDHFDWLMPVMAIGMIDAYQGMDGRWYACFEHERRTYVTDGFDDSHHAFMSAKDSFYEVMDYHLDAMQPFVYDQDRLLRRILLALSQIWPPAPVSYIEGLVEDREYKNALLMIASIGIGDGLSFWGQHNLIEFARDMIGCTVFPDIRNPDPRLCPRMKLIGPENEK